MNSISPLNLTGPASLGFAPSTGSSGATTGPAFAGFLDVAKQAIGEVSDMQATATRASESLMLGETDDIVGAMAAVEKGELAFKALLAIRSKLMSALDEVRNMPV